MYNITTEVLIFAGEIQKETNWGICTALIAALLGGKKEFDDAIGVESWYMAAYLKTEEFMLEMRPTAVNKFNAKEYGVYWWSFPVKDEADEDRQKFMNYLISKSKENV